VHHRWGSDSQRCCGSRHPGHSGALVRHAGNHARIWRRFAFSQAMSLASHGLGWHRCRMVSKRGGRNVYSPRVRELIHATGNPDRWLCPVPSSGTLPPNEQPLQPRASGDSFRWRLWRCRRELGCPDRGNCWGTTGPRRGQRHRWSGGEQWGSYVQRRWSFWWTRPGRDSRDC
jgi:hypothetical protein